MDISKYLQIKMPICTIENVFKIKIGKIYNKLRLSELLRST